MKVGPDPRPPTRRGFLALTTTATAAAAGCLSLDSLTRDNPDPNNTAHEDPVEYDGPGVTPEGTSLDDLPALAGRLTIYSGRREAQIGPIFDRLRDHYPDLDLAVRYGDNETHVQTIIQEGQNTPADLLYTQDAGTLGALAAAGRTVPLTEDVLETVPREWRDPEGTWTGLSGRVRCVAYNTDAWSADALPTDIYAYPTDDRFRGAMGWRIDSGSFLSFIRAMMLVDGEDQARWYLEAMRDAGVRNYEGGSTTPLAIAGGEVTVGFINQYYAARVLADRPDAPVGVTFTDSDVGSLFNVAGAGVIDASDNHGLARNLVRTLLSREIQEAFVGLNKEYAVIPGVPYVGDLPALSEINPPEFDLNQLADIQPAVDLLRDTGLR